jgi:hypothetical protein
MQTGRTADLVKVEDLTSLAHRKDAHHPLTQNLKSPLLQMMARIGMTLARLMAGPSPIIWNSIAKTMQASPQSLTVLSLKKTSALRRISKEMNMGKFP